MSGGLAVDDSPKPMGWGERRGKSEVEVVQVKENVGVEKMGWQ